MTSRRRPAAPSSRIALAIAAALVAACAGDDDADTAPLVFDAADVHVLGTSDSIAVVRDLAVTADGGAWVQNSVDPLFLRLDPDGAVTTAYGRTGGGPEEFGAPTRFVAGGPGDEVWTFDRRRHALVRVHVPGDAWSEVSLPRDAIPPGGVTSGHILEFDRVRTARLGGEVVMARRATMDEVAAVDFWTTIWGADLVALDPASGAVRTVVSLPDILGDLDAHFRAVGPGFPPFPLWVRLWAVCGDVVRVHDFRRNQLRGFRPDGSEVDPVRLPPPPFGDVKPRQFVRTLFDLVAAERAGAVTDGVGRMPAADSARLIEGATARIDASPAQLGAVLPHYVDLRCDDDGAVWLRPLDLERGGMSGGPVWLRVTPDGGTREVRFPDRFDPYRFTDGRAWGVLRDAMDVASVAWVEVIPAARPPASP